MFTGGLGRSVHSWDHLLLCVLEYLCRWMSSCSDTNPRCFHIILISYMIILWLILHHGRGTSNEVWVFVMIDTSHIPALGYIRVVTRGNAATLLPIIQNHVAPGMGPGWHTSSNGFSWDCEPLHWICELHNRGTYRGWRGAMKLNLPVTCTNSCDVDRVQHNPRHYPVS